ncbi:NTE family protein [Chitinophaga costaii]|uniref:NTE family protein n=1 Tax=Chitinophaga costaii TaxID=1335309 RepID=A0A1C3YVY9_9BACT|nr:patatin-like phospholipase family protein [Chitinophaga costaii]PUZ30123.1 hypothetical protein DCM91_01220 [Chitinophaga costaii]SCB74223.1 NTE family protein [Chitinophaga costaii]
MDFVFLARIYRYCCGLFLVLAGTCFVASAQTNDQRPRIGLALSGGGAKGLAHIGILEAIDSAGLKIDYVAGTSMGSIVGALYAVGYSADTIEAIARRINWPRLFSNRPLLSEISYEEKSEFGKYALEVPFQGNKPKLESGVIVGEELWLQLAQLFWPVQNLRDFSKFNIPFKCIATDIATGDRVTLDSGDIVMSVRASIAIPSVFSAVEIGDQKLVDGGVVRNFPVLTLKDMGANITIGSNVGQGLRKAAELKTPLDMIYQLGFYKDAMDFKEERKVTDVFIQHELREYSAASFSSVDSIIDKGKRLGRQFYPVFKHLADSLRALYPDAAPVVCRMPEINRVQLTALRVNGLVHSDSSFFVGKTGLKIGQWYNDDQIHKAVQNVYGTRFYKEVTYRLEPQGGNRVLMDIHVEETPLTYVKAALNYNTYTGVSAILNITRRNFLVKNSNAFLTAGLSENPRLKGEFLKYLGRQRNIGFRLYTNFENNDLPIYENFRQLQEYNSKYLDAGGSLQYALNNKMIFGIATQWEHIWLKPKISSYVEVSGHTRQLNSYFYYGLNTLNRTVFPTKGVSIQLEAGEVYSHHPNFNFYQASNPGDTTRLNFDNYRRLLLKVNYYVRASHKSAFDFSTNAAVNLGYRPNIVNNYIVGGLTDQVRYQIPFAGLYEGEVLTGSISTLGIKYQYECLNNLFIIPRANVAIYNYADKARVKYNYLSGYALGAGYSSALGPIEASLIYSDQSETVGFYVNVGFNF